MRAFCCLHLNGPVSPVFFFFLMCISSFLLAHTRGTYISPSRGRQRTPTYLSVCSLIFAPLCRLLRLNRPAFERDGANSTQRGSIPLGGEGDDNALLKYNTLPWHRTPTMYIPLYMTACLRVTPTFGVGGTMPPHPAMWDLKGTSWNRLSAHSF